MLVRSRAPPLLLSHELNGATLPHKIFHVARDTTFSTEVLLCRPAILPLKNCVTAHKNLWVSYK